VGCRLNCQGQATDFQGLAYHLTYWNFGGKTAKKLLFPDHDAGLHINKLITNSE